MNYNNAEFYTSYGSFKQIPKSERTEIAFSGRSNVGKSSLINKIFNRKSLARVSAVPGKTATINFYSLENLYFVDLPGYGYAKVTKSDKERWAGTDRGVPSRRPRACAGVPAHRLPPPADLRRCDDGELPDRQRNTVRCDTHKSGQAVQESSGEERRASLLNELPCAEDITIIEFSAQTGEGRDEIRAIIEEIAADDETEENEE